VDKYTNKQNQNVYQSIQSLSHYLLACLPSRAVPAETTHLVHQVPKLTQNGLAVWLQQWPNVAYNTTH